MREAMRPRLSVCLSSAIRVPAGECAAPRVSAGAKKSASAAGRTEGEASAGRAPRPAAKAAARLPPQTRLRRVIIQAYSSPPQDWDGGGPASIAKARRSVLGGCCRRRGNPQVLTQEPRAQAQGRGGGGGGGRGG